MQHTKRRGTEKISDKDGRALYKLMNNAVYGNTMENLRYRSAVKLVSNKKDCLKWISKPSYMSHKIIDNDLVAIRKNKVTLTLNKSAFIGMCTLELNKVLMYKFIMITLKVIMVTTQDYHSQKLIVSCMKLKLKMSMTILATIKKCLTLAIIQLSQNIMIIQTN